MSYMCKINLKKKKKKRTVAVYDLQYLFAFPQLNFVNATKI